MSRADLLIARTFIFNKCGIKTTQRMIHEDITLGLQRLKGAWCKWARALVFAPALTLGSWNPITCHLASVEAEERALSQTKGGFHLSELTGNKLRVVPHFSSGIVERAKHEGVWKSPHARKGDTRRGERKMRDYRQSPGFWTNALLSQRKTVIGPSMEICQHLSKTRQPLSTLNIITIYRTNN